MIRFLYLIIKILLPMKDLKNSKIIVLMGGWNEEAEVSIDSGNSVLQCLLDNGYINARGLQLDNNLIENLKLANPDIVFIALHGKFGEDGQVQAILNFLQIPYTHSSVLPCSIAMNKHASANAISSLSVVKSPKFALLSKNNPDNNSTVLDIGYPFVIKPLDSGSSVGVEIFLNDGDFDIDSYHWNFGDKILIEKYIKGQEVQVAVIKNEAVGAIEVRPKKLFYDYECKYSDNMTDYVMPAEVNNATYQKLLDISTKIHRSLDCNNLSRIDFIVEDDTNEIYFLELNTHPGMTSHSLVPKIAQYYNISFIEIIESLLLTAKCDI